MPASPVPVVIVGNLMVGGTGKTPVVIAVVQALQARGWTPGVISRGYGAKVDSVPRTGRGVSLEASIYGDEPALIANTTGAPLAVHPKRIAAHAALLRQYPEVDVVIADDGLQHLALPRDVEIVVQDHRGLGNGRVLPAGPLREPSERLSTVDLLISNLTSSQTAPLQQPFPREQLIMRLAPVALRQLETGTVLSWHDWKGQHGSQTIDAVAAIGQPVRFFSMLRDHGLRLGRTVALPDHDPFLQSPFESLTAEIILITPKDAVKCADYSDSRVWIVDAQPQFSDPEWLQRLHERLSAIAGKKKTDRITLSV